MDTGKAPDKAPQDSAQAPASPASAAFERPDYSKSPSLVTWVSTEEEQQSQGSPSKPPLPPKRVASPSTSSLHSASTDDAPSLGPPSVPSLRIPPRTSNPFQAPFFSPGQADASGLRPALRSSVRVAEDQYRHPSSSADNPPPPAPPFLGPSVSLQDGGPAVEPGENHGSVSAAAGKPKKVGFLGHSQLRLPSLAIAHAAGTPGGAPRGAPTPKSPLSETSKEGTPMTSPLPAGKKQPSGSLALTSAPDSPLSVTGAQNELFSLAVPIPHSEPMRKHSTPRTSVFPGVSANFGRVPKARPVPHSTMLNAPVPLSSGPLGTAGRLSKLSSHHRNDARSAAQSVAFQCLDPVCTKCPPEMHRVRNKRLIERALNHSKSLAKKGMLSRRVEDDEEGLDDDEDEDSLDKLPILSSGGESGGGESEDALEEMMREEGLVAEGEEEKKEDPEQGRRMVITVCGMRIIIKTWRCQEMQMWRALRILSGIRPSLQFNPNNKFMRKFMTAHLFMSLFAVFLEPLILYVFYVHFVPVSFSS